MSSRRYSQPSNLTKAYEGFIGGMIQDQWFDVALFSVTPAPESYLLITHYPRGCIYIYIYMLTPPPHDHSFVCVLMKKYHGMLIVARFVWENASFWITTHKLDLGRGELAHTIIISWNVALHETILFFLALQLWFEELILSSETRA